MTNVGQGLLHAVHAGINEVVRVGAEQKVISLLVMVL